VTLIEKLLRAGAFDPSRSFDELVRYHVRFERLTPDVGVEQPLERALNRGGRAGPTCR